MSNWGKEEGGATRGGGREEEAEEASEYAGDIRMCARLRLSVRTGKNSASLREKGRAGSKASENS